MAMPSNLIELILGLGIIGMLWRIQGQLGCIKTEIKHLAHGFSDHEKRIRALETDAKE